MRTHNPPHPGEVLGSGPPECVVADQLVPVQQERWYHRHGCRTWFQAERDTRTNEVLRTYLA